MANLHIQPVQSLDAPELALYCTLRCVEEHERAGVLVATNIKVVKRLLASRYTVVSALLTPAWLEQLEPQLRAWPEAEISVYVGERKLLETITGYQLHQGALAVAKIPPQPDFETLLKSVSRPLLLAAVEGIASAENLGAVVRNCAAFGVHFLIVGETCRLGVVGAHNPSFLEPLGVAAFDSVDAAVATCEARLGRRARVLAVADAMATVVRQAYSLSRHFRLWCSISPTSGNHVGDGRRRKMSGFRIGRIFGIELAIHPSWFVVLVLF